MIFVDDMCDDFDGDLDERVWGDGLEVEVRLVWELFSASKIVSVWPEFESFFVGEVLEELFSKLSLFSLLAVFEFMFSDRVT